MAPGAVNLAWTAVSAQALARVAAERPAAAQAKALASEMGVWQPVTPADGGAAAGDAGEGEGAAGVGDPASADSSSPSAPPSADALRASILSDLYFNAYRFASVEQRFADEKVSTLLAILQRVHSAAVADCLATPRAFALFKELVLQHSVQRPPYSVGVFSLADMKTVLNYGLVTYFKHFRLYTYAFTRKQLTDFEERGEAWERPPALPSLADAMPEAKWLELKEQERLEEEARQRQAQEEEAKRKEQEIREKIQAEYEAAVGADVAKAVNTVFEKHMPELEAQMKAKFDGETAALAERLAALEAQSAA